MRHGVTAVIPTIPPRRETTLHRAIDSVLHQTRMVDAVSIVSDTQRAGAAATRNLALAAVDTEWSALLDDDDEWNKFHVEQLLAEAEDQGADMVYPWFTVPDGFDPWPEREGQPFSPEVLTQYNYVPVTVLVRTELIRDVGGFRPKGPPENPCDDWGAWDALVAAGAKIVHLNRRSWIWHWHGGPAGNTSGRPIW